MNQVSTIVFCISLMSVPVSAMQITQVARAALSSRGALSSPVQSTKRMLFKKSQQELLYEEKKRELLDVLIKIGKFDEENKLLLIQMRIDAEKEELHKLIDIQQRILAGDDFCSKFTRHENISMYARAPFEYKVVSENLKPILEHMKKDE